MTNSGGYNVANLKDVNARFKCFHCKRILREPMQAGCGHRLCNSCIQDIMNMTEQVRCKACEQDEADEVEILDITRCYPDRAITKELEKQEFECPYECSAPALTLTDLEIHQKACPSKPEPCIQCNQLTPRLQIKTHMEKECLKRKVPCPDCKTLVIAECLQEHSENDCTGNKRSCHYCQQLVKDTDKDMENHVKKNCTVGWHRENSCPYECPTMNQKNVKKHRKEDVYVHLDRLLSWTKDNKYGVPSNKTENQFSSPINVQTIPSDVVKEKINLQSSALRETETVNALRELENRITPVENQLKNIKFSKSTEATLLEVHKAIDEGRKFKELTDLVKREYDLTIDKLKETGFQLTKMTKDKTDVEQKMDQVIRILAYKEIKLSELERRLDNQDYCGNNGILVWKISNVTQRRREAKDKKITSIYSPPLFTGVNGYKLCARLYLNGDGVGSNKFLSLYISIMRNDYDALMPWPFAKQVTFTLIDQSAVSSTQSIVQAFRPDTTSRSFHRPTEEMNMAEGVPLFAPLSELDNPQRSYVQDDVMFIRIEVDRTDIPT